MIKTITDLGDPALLLPSAAILFVMFCATGQRATARGWVLAVAFCIATVVIAKIGFEAWGDYVPALGIRSPSGHIALSLTFYGGVAMLFADRRPLVLRLAAWLAAMILVAAIAVSRLILRLHTPEESVAAFLIGGCALALLAAERTAAPVALPWKSFAFLFLLLAVVTHGHHLTAERQIIRVAHWLRG